MATKTFDEYWAASNIKALLGRSQVFFLGGTVVAALGFTLPWFRNEHAIWFYNGWELMTDEVGWIGAIYVGFLALVVAGAALFKRSANVSAVLAMAALLVALATALPLMMAVADSRQGSRGLFAVVWSIGLLVMLAGEAVMLFAAFAGWVLKAIQESLISEDLA